MKESYFFGYETYKPMSLCTVLVEIQMQHSHFVLKSLLNRYNIVIFGAVDGYSRKVREGFLPSLKLP